MSHLHFPCNSLSSGAGLGWAGLAGLENVRRMYGDCMERAAGTGSAVLCSTMQYCAVLCNYHAQLSCVLKIDISSESRV